MYSDVHCCSSIEFCVRVKLDETQPRVKGKMTKPIEKPPDHFLSEKLGKPLSLCLLIIVITLFVYGQVWKYDFIIWDDPSCIISNFHIQTGFHWDSIRWAFTTNHNASWFPLTWLSHMLDYQMYGLSPGGHHLTNLWWHLLNCLLLFRILHSMTREVWPSVFVALLFTIHPLRVESVQGSSRPWRADRPTASGNGIM